MNITKLSAAGGSVPFTAPADSIAQTFVKANRAPAVHGLPAARRAGNDVSHAYRPGVASALPAELWDLIAQFSSEELWNPQADVHAISSALNYCVGAVDRGAVRDRLRDVQTVLKRRCDEAESLVDLLIKSAHRNELCSAWRLFPWISPGARKNLIHRHDRLSLSIYKGTDLYEMARHRSLLPRKKVDSLLRFAEQGRDDVIRGLLADTQTPLDADWLSNLIDREARTEECRSCFIPWLGYGNLEARKILIRRVVEKGAGSFDTNGIEEDAMIEALIDSMARFDEATRDYIVSTVLELSASADYRVSYLAAAPGLTHEQTKDIAAWIEVKSEETFDFDGYYWARHKSASFAYPHLDEMLVKRGLSCKLPSNRLTTVSYVASRPGTLTPTVIESLVAHYSAANPEAQTNAADTVEPADWAGATAALWPYLSVEQQEKAKQFIENLRLTDRAMCLHAMALHLTQMPPDARSWLMASALKVASPSDNSSPASGETSEESNDAAAFDIFRVIFPAVHLLSPGDQEDLFERLRGCPISKWAMHDQQDFLLKVARFGRG